ncbi:C1 family peptidase [Bdellovibrio sp. NC01]|uniref:C1 family peptidase n=1 Tax=Bdellovibrio sp. NC01 TaxID=2220073 RepID=UPI001159F4CC|nr:C1 family peptidase [Bdellovibrio sp. NC01]QDK36763.1 hypothetical protein DOE51_03680 [Bdellovibrio sp. NC01]
MTGTSLHFAISILLFCSAGHAQTAGGRKKVTFNPPAKTQPAAKADGGNLNADCGDMDLNQGANSPFNKIPVYDQDGTGICYAYTTAQMTDYYRFKKGDTSYDLTNPVYAAYDTYGTKNPFKANSLYAGVATDVNDAIRAKGVCSDKEVKARLAEYMKVSGGSEAEVLHFLETVYQNLNPKSNKTDWTKVSSVMTSTTGVSCKQQEQLKSVALKRNVMGASAPAVLQNLFKNCKTHPVKVPDIEVFQFGSDVNMKRAMDKGLNQTMPAQLMVCANLFTDKSYKGVVKKSQNSQRDAMDGTRPDCEAHSILVTGRKSINGQCSYLVRNSWGTNWKPKGAKACACRTWSGQYKQICSNPDEVDEYVGCWYGASELTANTGSVGVFK